MTAPTKVRPECDVAGCTRRATAKGKCQPHYHRLRRGTLPGHTPRPRCHTKTAGDPSWVEQAACRPGTGVDPEIFHPVSEAPGSHDVQVARAVCSGCVVAAECLTWAVTNLPYGIAGGLTADERRDLRRDGGAR